MIDRQYRCPVCGAPIEGEKCEYCGCVIYDFANISTEEPRYIRLAVRNPSSGQMMLLQMKAIAVNPCVNIQYDPYDITSQCTIAVEFQAVTENDKLFTVTLCDKPYRESWRDDIEQ